MHWNPSITINHNSCNKIGREREKTQINIIGGILYIKVNYMYVLAIII